MTTQVVNDFSPTQIVLQVGFKSLTPDTSDLVNVGNPRISITRGFEEKPTGVDSLGVAQNADGSYPLAPLTPPVTGTYKFSFLTTNLQPGLLKVDFAGEIQETRLDSSIVTHTRHVIGEIEVGPISRLDDLINRVQYGLMDDFPEAYRLDEPLHQWGRDQLFTYLRDAIDVFNTAGPRQTSWDFNSLPTGVQGLIAWGGKIFALWARARLEKANEMDYSDVHTINIKRADFYKQLADEWYRDWKAQITEYKRSTPPNPIGIRSQRLPFRLFRVIGMLPNYQSFFSG